MKNMKISNLGVEDTGQNMVEIQQLAAALQMGNQAQ